jgi:hypothetical protein
MAKSPEYNLGWQNAMAKLAILRYNINQQLYLEKRWHDLQVFLMSAQGREKDYAEGELAALTLFDKTGHIPVAI